MNRFHAILFRSPLAAMLAFGLTAVTASAADLSRYRDFQLGSSLAAIVKQAGASPSQTKETQRRPALLQDLEWYPQPLGPSARPESVKDVTFSFYDGTLFRIVVNYDRYETEGLTGADFVEAISQTYGTAVVPGAVAAAGQGRYGEQEETLARWEDPQYRFELIRSSYGPSFRLVATVPKLDAQVKASVAEAKRLDEQDAPRRDAARAADEVLAAKAKLDQARLVNKPKFRP